MQNMTIEGEVTGVWTGPLTKIRHVVIQTDDGGEIDLPTLKFDMGQKVKIEVREVA